jgi:hypothetical protein
VKLSEKGEIIEPVLGDAELVRMEFDPSGVIIHFKLSDDRPFALKLDDVRWMSFTTDCTQNVIEKITITTNTDEVEAPKHIRDLLLVRRFQIPGDASIPEPLLVVRIEPLAGPALSCIVGAVDEV